MTKAMAIIALVLGIAACCWCAYWMGWRAGFDRGVSVLAGEEPQWTDGNYERHNP